MSVLRQEDGIVMLQTTGHTHDLDGSNLQEF
jgi:hypothetical protein